MNISSKQEQHERLINRSKYLSNSITIKPNQNVLPTIFCRYYSWLTDSFNFYNATIGNIVKMFCVFGKSEVNPNIPESKGIYVKALESIAYGIIKSTTTAEKLNLFDYINYQIKGMAKIFNISENELKNDECINVYKTLFYIQDLNNDDKLDIQELTVSLAYLDMQDGILNGNFRYEDAINLGENLDTETGRFKMKMELIHLKHLLYD